ncbi:hypothetical protein KSS87_001586 [Heliosperma pusillum]|nr:hypothetical protein KSS87_001586 [Heliosperma pusillum]
MTMFHFFNCAILTFGPHFVYFSATPLSEYDTLGTSIKAAIVYLVTALVKLVCLATFLKVSDNDNFDPYQELLKLVIGLVDVAGLYYALTQLTHRNISQNHKFQAVGLGWAFADSVLHRLAPLWVGARGLEFTWEFVLQGLEANAHLVGAWGCEEVVGLACLVSLLVQAGTWPCWWAVVDGVQVFDCNKFTDFTISFSGVDYFPCCNGILDVAQEKQAKDFDTYYILMCGNSRHHAIYHKLPEASHGMALPRSGRFSTVHVFGDGFYQLATVFCLPKALLLSRQGLR